MTTLEDIGGDMKAIHVEVSGINTHLERLNGSVAKVKDRVVDLEKDYEGHKGEMKAFKTMVRVICAPILVGITISLIKFSFF